MPDGHAPFSVTSEPVASVVTARRLAGVLAARAGAHDRDASFPHDNFADLRDAGMLALTAPEADGGSGAGLAEACAVLTEIGAGCASTALVLAMQFINVALLRRGGRWPAGPAASVLRSAASSGGLINVLRVEPALGTPARGGLPDTLARRTAAGWAISGRKTTSTGAPGLAWMLVFARTDEQPVRMGSFLVPAHAPGVRIEETWDHLGLRASGSHDVVLEDVAVPLENAVDVRAPEAWAVPDHAAAAWSTLSIAALYTGVATAARDWLMRFLRDRVPSNLGASLATLPRMQDAVGEIEGLLLANARIIRSAAADHDAGATPPAAETGILKVVAADNAIRAVQRAIEVAGNPGLSRHHALERHWRDVQCVRVHTPQTDTARLTAGRHVLGL